jgi:tripartite motif-containing protein 71
LIQNFRLYQAPDTIQCQKAMVSKAYEKTNKHICRQEIFFLPNLKICFNRIHMSGGKTLLSMPTLLLSLAAALILLSPINSILPFFLQVDATSLMNGTEGGFSFENATEYELINEWGSEGDDDGQFVRPHDLDFSPTEDKLYIVDRDNNRIQVFDKNGTFLFKWGEEGEDDGEFTLPYGLDVDKEGNVWVADRGNSRIQKFDAEGNFLFAFGSEGEGESEFRQLRHVGVDDQLRYLYGVDSDNHRIQKFDINGSYVEAFGTLGNASGQFNVPVTLVIDSEGDLFVNERGNERVQKLDSQGNPILMWGSKGPNQSQFCHSEHLATDKYDNVYVADPQSDAGCSLEASIKKFDNNGKFITSWRVLPAGDSEADPEHLAVDSDGTVYLSERGNHRIQVYRPVR